MTWMKTNAVSLVFFSRDVRIVQGGLVGSSWKRLEDISHPLESVFLGANRSPGPPFAERAQINMPMIVAMQAKNEQRKNLFNL